MKTSETTVETGAGRSLDTNDVLRRTFDVCVRKTRRNIKDLADEPNSWALADDGDYSRRREGFFEIGTGLHRSSPAWRCSPRQATLEVRLRRAGRSPLLPAYLQMGGPFEVVKRNPNENLWQLARRSHGMAAADEHQLETTNWQDVPGSDNANSVSILLTNRNAFFRLVYP